jgi:N-methylhydantoinase B
MPLMMERLRPVLPWKRGSMWLCNDPRHGGTHLPDLTLVAPVYVEEEGRQSLVGFVANRAHHADIGGLSPGSLPLSTELFHEGLILPPVRLVSGGRVREEIVALVSANSRTGRERRGDLAAQVAANQIGIRRLQELFARHGRLEVERRAEEARRYSEAAVRAVLTSAPDGVFRYADYLDDDGAGQQDVRIEVTATVAGGEITLDFSGSSPETAGSVNATEAVTRSACYYVIRCLVDEEIPMNSATFAPVRVIAPEGTVVNARFPRAVAAGNVETSQRIVDVLLGALAPAFPDKIPAMSQGTMNNLTIGGYDPFRGQAFAYYETICGGAGGSPERAGADAVHTHMTNTRNTPIEALEMHYPLRVREYALRDGSGGDGEHAGGTGVVRTIELLAPAQVSIISERRTRGAPGLAGGKPGKPGINLLESSTGEVTVLPSKATVECAAGTTVSIKTPGGGGWGRLG